MTPRGFIHDEGIGNGMEVIVQGLVHRDYRHEVTWLLPHIQRAVPYLKCVVIAGTKPN